MDYKEPLIPFTDCFKKLTISGEQQEFICTGEVEYGIDKVSREMEITLHLSRLHRASGFLAMQKEIGELYSLSRCSVRPKYDLSLFEEDYFTDILEFANELIPGATAFFSDANVSFSAPTLSVRLAPGKITMPQALGCDIVLSRMLSEMFSEDRFTVELSGDAGNLEDYNRRAEEAHVVTEVYRETYENADSGLNPNAGGISYDADRNLLLCGHLTLDITNPELLYGRAVPREIVSELTPIGKLDRAEKPMLFCGRLFYMSEYRESRSGKRGILSLYVTDEENSVTVKIVGVPEKVAPLAELKNGTPLLIAGKVSPDEFDQNEPSCKADVICRVKEVFSTDDYEGEKRVELHLHTNLSAMDAIATPKAVIETAARMGHRAVAITDHGNVHAFPMVMNAYDALKKSGKLPEGFKVLYGMEGYFVDDTARALYGEQKAHFEQDNFVVFDLETTGLSAASCGITEIGAVRIQGGKVTDRFSTYVNPGMKVPAEITKLTGITDEMVQDAPSEQDAVRDFLDFCADSILIAHNAPFDTSFISRVSRQHSLTFSNTYLDTVALSRYLNTDLKRHTLDSLAAYYKLGEFNHHRAVDDTEMLAAIFFKMCEKMRAEGIHTTEELSIQMSSGCDPRMLPENHITLIAKNETGLKNLYKLVSTSYLQYFRRHPRIPKSVLKEHREGLLIGSACESGEFYKAIVAGKSFGDLLKIADFYDYFEIQPLANNAFMVEKGMAKDMDTIREYNRTVLSIAKKQNKPCCATGDVHFLRPQDAIYRQILLSGMGFSDADSPTPLYYRTTQEMLDEFSYLSPEEAYEAVVAAPLRIADMVEEIRPIPSGKYPPHIPGAVEELENACYKRAHEMFGEELPQIVADRLKRELAPIQKHGFSILYVISKRLVEKSEELGFHVGSRGSVGSSLVATLSGISEVNPLPPYYLCEHCHHSEFITDGTYGSGFDMPPKDCPHCAHRMTQDGHNIPFETFLGFDGDKEPDIDLNFSGYVQGSIHKYTEELFGEQNAFRAGTISGLADRTAYGYAKKYVEEHGRHLTKAAIQYLTCGCIGVRRTTGQHPGGIIVIPRDKEIYDFTPVQHPADKSDSDIITTHFPYEYLHETIYKLDILGHDVPTKYKMIEEYSGMSVLDVPIPDEKVLGLLLSPEPLGITADELGFATGTLALPELGTNFVCGLLQKTKPRCFSDLIQISGLSHGTGVWLGNAEELIAAGTCTISEVIGTRDNIMVYLMQKGLDKKLSFDIMECVRKKNKSLSESQEAEMRKVGVPEWYIESCKKITYLFPTAHAAAYIISALRLGWFKVHRPLEFYAAYFSAAPDGFDAEFAFLPLPELKERIRALGSIGVKATAKEQDTMNAMQILLEMRLRGIEPLPVDLRHSDAKKFLPENGKMRLPLISINGVGESAAESIADAMASGLVFSQLDLISSAKVSKTVLAKLDEMGALAGMPETNQLTLF